MAKKQIRLQLRPAQIEIAILQTQVFTRERIGRGGAWYQLGPIQLHLSIEEPLRQDCISKRHVCYTVSDLAEAEKRFRNAGVEILRDDLPTPGWSRFYVRDPGGNRLEIAQAV